MWLLMGWVGDVVGDMDGLVGWVGWGVINGVNEVNSRCGC